MKINKIGFCITATISIVSLCLTFIPCHWISNFAFAIFGSGIISAFICLVNYYVMRKNMVNEVSRHLYTLANTYRLLVCNIQSQKEIVINDFCNEINSFFDCCERSYDNSKGMFCISKKEKVFSKTIIELSEKIVDLDSCYKNCIAFLYSDLRNGKNTDSSIDYFEKQVKMSLKYMLKNIVKIENAFYKSETLKYKIFLREKFKYEFGEL